MIQSTEKPRKLPAAIRARTLEVLEERFDSLRPPKPENIQFRASEVLEIRKERFVISDKLSMLLDAALSHDLLHTFSREPGLDPQRAVGSLLAHARGHGAGYPSPMTISDRPGAAHRLFLTSTIPDYTGSFSPQQAHKFAGMLEPGVMLLSRASLIEPLRLSMLAHEERHRSIALLAVQDPGFRPRMKEAFNVVMKAAARSSINPAQLSAFPEADRNAPGWQALLQRALGHDLEPEEFFNRCFDLGFYSYRREFEACPEDNRSGLLPALACRMVLAEASENPSTRHNQALRRTLGAFSAIQARARENACLDLKALLKYGIPGAAGF